MIERSSFIDVETTYEAMVSKRVYCIPRLHRELLESQNQYVLIKGGRGGFKTTSIICYFIEESYGYSSCAFLFTREIAKSIADSVHAIVVDLIRAAGLTDDFAILNTSITNKRTGVKFLFLGLRATGGATAMSQINKAKGLHKIRMTFFEEGQDVSENSLNTLLPTANRKGSVKLINPIADEDVDLTGSRFFVAMNPNKEIDPIVSKFKPYVNAGVAVIAHINMMDIAEDEPELKDEQLINQMELEKDEYYFGHVWLGEPFHTFAGLPFSKHNVIEQTDVCCHYAFLDPSFKGGDYTALAFLGEDRNGKAVAWGYCFKQAWNMSPCIDDCIKLIRKYGPDTFWHEDNSLGTVVEQEYGRRGIHTIGRTSFLNKEDRIYKVAAFTKGSVSLVRSESNSIWIDNVLDYSDDAEHDDGADSLASVVIQSGIIRDKINYK